MSHVAAKLPASTTFVWRCMAAVVMAPVLIVAAGIGYVAPVQFLGLIFATVPAATETSLGKFAVLLGLTVALISTGVVVLLKTQSRLSKPLRYCALFFLGGVVCHLLILTLVGVLMLTESPVP